LKPVNDQPVLNEDFKKLTTDPRVTMLILPLPTTGPKVQQPIQPKKTDPGIQHLPTKRGRSPELKRIAQRS